MELFTKFLSEADVSARLTVPTVAFTHFDGFGRREFMVTDWTGEEWKFHFSTRRIDHPRPVFTGDWLPFSQAKRLQPYDFLVFIQLEGGRYRVEVLRETDFKLFGQKVVRKLVN